MAQSLNPESGLARRHPSGSDVPGPNRVWYFARALLIGYAALTAYISLAPLAGVRHGPWSTPTLTVVGFAFALWHAWLYLGRGRTLVLLALTIGVSLAFESVGVVTGWIYGPYHYTDLLGPRFLGLVPYLIPVAWFMMIHPSQVIAERLLAGRRLEGWRRGLALSALAAVVMTSWDLLMDPMMVWMGAWVWEVPGAYFGVPAHNYAGWLVTTVVVYGAYRLVEGRIGSPPRATTSEASLAVWAFLITWSGNTLAALQFGLGGPALVGAFTAGLLGCLALLRTPLDP
ncbi:MAG TPA: carotenoid biosynthesis protein [Anaerolineales bacterium]|nr:carotenoid biosynthesis protein [Anaerolineales bacterium]